MLQYQRSRLVITYEKTCSLVAVGANEHPTKQETHTVLQWERMKVQASMRPAALLQWEQIKVRVGNRASNFLIFTVGKFANREAKKAIRDAKVAETHAYV